MRKSIAMKTADFDYLLPTNLIAQKPASPRDSARLLIVDKKTGRLTHDRFFNLDKYLRPHDLLVFNDTKVIPARISGQWTIDSSRKKIKGEILLLRDLEKSTWEAIGKPLKKFTPHTKIHLDKNTYFEIMPTKNPKRTFGLTPLRIKFNLSARKTLAYILRHGQPPLPPYIHANALRMKDKYQTLYAKNLGSAAAPTAGLHFTNRLLKKIRIVRAHSHVPFSNITYLTLHVGLGTFQPIRTDDLSKHHMHREWISVPGKTIRAIQQTRRNQGRVIAVGTTTTRALESIHACTGARPCAPTTNITRDTDIFITPGYKFKNVDALITNFHLPKSTLLAMVSAFASPNLIKKAYTEAIRRKYRFYSFGDAMLIV